MSLMAMCMTTAMMAQLPKLKPLSDKDASSVLMPMQKDGKWGYANEKRSMIIKPVFEAAMPFKSKKALVRVGGKWGLIDNYSRFVVPPKYEEIGDFSGDIAFVKLNGKYGVMDSDYNIIIPCQMDDIQSALSNDFYIIRRDGKYGTMSAKGTILIQPTMDKIVISNELGVPMVQLNGRYGTLSESGKMQVKPIYHDMKILSSTRILVSIDGLWGLADNYFNQLTEVEYDDIEAIPTNPNVLMVKRGASKGLITISGKQCTELNYFDIRPIGANNNYFITTRGGKNGIIDSFGKVLFGDEFDNIYRSATGQFYITKKNGSFGALDIVDLHEIYSAELPTEPVE